MLRIQPFYNLLVSNFISEIHKNNVWWNWAPVLTARIQLLNSFEIYIRVTYERTVLSVLIFFLAYTTVNED